MNCPRCKREVPVLIPSPTGEQDLCEECYAAVYRELQRRPSRKKGRLFLLFLVVVAVGAAFFFYSPREKPGAGEDLKRDLTGISGPNKPLTPRKRPRRERRSKVKSHLVRKEEKAPIKVKGKEERPFDYLQTEALSLKFSQARQLRKATVVPKQAAEGTPAPAFEAEEFQLIEVAFQAKLLSPSAAEVLVPLPVLVSAGEEFAPIQARLFDEPYQAPTPDTIELSEQARIVIVFASEEEATEALGRGAVIEEVTFWRKERKEVFPVTFLYALPKEAAPPFKVALGEREVPIKVLPPPPQQKKERVESSAQREVEEEKVQIPSENPQEGVEGEESLEDRPTEPGPQEEPPLEEGPTS